MQMSALEFEDFSGGMTDYPLNAPLNRYELAKNFIIEKQGRIGKLVTRPGSEIYDADAARMPNSSRVGYLKYFNDILFAQSVRKLYYLDSSTWNVLQGPSSNDLFPTGVDATTVLSSATWRDHLIITNSDFSSPSKIYKDGSSNWQLRTAGLPLLASDPTVTPPASTGVNYIYAFVHKYEYTVGTVTFLDRGPVRELAAAEGGATPDASTWAISNIPVLANSTTYNYDTSNIKVEIYRTVNGGGDLYYIGEVTNGTTTYNDTSSDSTIQANEPIYTADGTVDREPPPLSKLVHVTEDVGYYAHVKIGTEVYKNRVYQSIPGDVDSVPGAFYEEVEDEIVALSSVRGVPILACGNSAYRLDGRIDALGLGNIVAKRISDTCSCVSAGSIVQTLDGCFWAGSDGFYFSDGYRVIKINEDLDKTYVTLVNTDAKKRRVVGKYDSKLRKIYWSMQTNSGSSDNDSVWVCDLNFGISENMPFTYWDGGDFTDNFSVTAIEMVGRTLIRGDVNGYVFSHSDTVYTDPAVDTSAAVANWLVKVIVYDFKSTATNFGTVAVRKWVTRVNIVCDTVTNLSLQINTIDDNGRKTGALKPIRDRGLVVWGDADIYWGDPNIIWNYAGMSDEWRRMPANHLRCEYKQIQLTNALVAIVSSDILGTCTVSNAASTATLDDSASFDWPSLSVDYYIAFSSDGYDKEFLVTARTADVLTFSDPDSIAPDTPGLGWVVRGKPKGEILRIEAFAMHYSLLSRTQRPFDSSSTGEVGASD